MAGEDAAERGRVEAREWQGSRKPTMLSNEDMKRIARRMGMPVAPPTSWKRDSPGRGRRRKQEAADSRQRNWRGLRMSQQKHKSEQQATTLSPRRQRLIRRAEELHARLRRPGNACNRNCSECSAFDIALAGDYRECLSAALPTRRPVRATRRTRLSAVVSMTRVSPVNRRRSCSVV